MYKMIGISAGTWKKCGIEIAIFNNLTKNKKELWLKICHIQVELGVKNMSDLVRKEIYGIFNTKIPQKNGFGVIKHGLMMVFTLLKNLL